MSDISQRIARLSPGARAILERRLKDKDLLHAAQPIRRRGDEGPAPVSFAQQRLWVLDRLDPGKAVYNIPQHLRIRGRLDVQALERALDTIRERHAVLRSVFRLVDGNPVQVVSEPPMPSLPIVDLSALAEREKEVLRAAEEEAQTPFDLARGPLLRTTLLRLSEEEHVLLVTLHHIVFDGWSDDIFREELAALYEAYHAGRASPLSPLAIQYADFAVWQREWLSGAVLEEQLSYWKRQLDRAPAVLELPESRPRPPIQTFRGATETTPISKELSEAIRTLSQRERATLFMTLLAAFQVLLLRHSGQDDITVGSPVAGRNRSDIEGLIGFFVNTLVFRTDLSGDPSFRELLKRVREVAIGAYAHQDLPFEKLVEELNPERTLSHSPLFQVMMILQNAPSPPLRLGSLSVTPLRFRAAAKYDLTLSFVDTGVGLRAALQYNADLFEPSSVRRMLAHFEVLLGGIVADPDRRLSQLPLMTAEERHQTLVEWNQTEAEYPNEKTVHRLFEEQVERTPGAVAVVFEGERLTYRELNRRANRVAHYLTRHGVGPEVLVGICLERSLEMVVGLLGILKAGGAYVPLDPAYPRQRLAFMLEDTQARVVLTQESLGEVLPEGSFERVRLDADWAQIEKESGENPESQATAENLAYVIYTSGSTGTPKGAAVSHQNVSNLICWHQKTYDVKPTDRATLLASSAFDASVWELWPYLAAGASLYIADEETRIASSKLSRWLESEQITICFIPTPLAQAVLADADPPRGSLRFLLTGGDQLRRPPVRDYGFHLVNHYGPTEATVVATAGLVQTQEETDGLPSIGRPIHNTRIYLLDRHQQPVPVGVPGELYVGGEGVARGYLNRPELTAERFLPDPFFSGGRMYKTGDRARFAPSGDIQFLGRLDHQVKIRGFRIELGEIESALRKHPAVDEAVVVARRYGPEDQRLVAYVVGNKEEIPLVAEFRDFLKKTLPEPMLPFSFVILDALPLTPNGKLDLAALPAPDHGRPELERRYLAPRDSLEVQLTEIWESVLALEHIGVNDNFFELGGYSLLAVRLFGKIEKSFGRQLPLATIFEAPTIGQLAGILRREGWSPTWSSLVAIQPGGSRPPFYCIHAAGGNVLTYLDLSRHLGPDQPVYGLQAQGLDGKKSPHTRIEDMAAYYIKEIQQLQPKGPYYLGGTSAGGLVAFEMAQQLHAQEEEVGVLALFDTWGPDYPRRMPGITRRRLRVSAFVERVDLHVGNLIAAEGLKEKFAYFVRKSVRLRKRLAHHGAGYWKKLREVPREIVDPLPPTLRKVENMSRKASDRYVPRAYPGRVTLFRASKQPVGFYPDPELGWTRVAEGGMEVYEVPGHHGAIVYEPRIGILARQLAECLERARSARHASSIQMHREAARARA